MSTYGGRDGGQEQGPDTEQRPRARGRSGGTGRPPRSRTAQALGARLLCSSLPGELSQTAPLFTASQGPGVPGDTQGNATGGLRHDSDSRCGVRGGSDSRDRGPRCPGERWRGSLRLVKFLGCGGAGRHHCGQRERGHHLGSLEGGRSWSLKCCHLLGFGSQMAQKP